MLFKKGANWLTGESTHVSNVVKRMGNKRVLLPVGSNSCLRGDEGFSCFGLLSVGSLLRIFGVLKRRKQEFYWSTAELSRWKISDD